MATKEIKISTKNTNLGEDIEVNINVQVPDTLEEAAEFYGSEEKLIESIQTDVARRRANAARPLLRDAEEPMPWETVAQQAADAYQPGRRGGFGAAAIDESELESVESTDDLIALLRSKGIQITGGVPA